MKNNKIIRILTLFGIILLFLGIAAYSFIAATSDPAVIFYGSDNEIRFERALPFPGNSEPDLFPNLKKMMPGDSVTQQIEIGAKYMRDKRVAIYVKSENPNDDYRKLIDEYGHYVDLSIKNGEDTIEGDLKNGVLLGIFDKTSSNILDVTLSIDIEAGNELQDLIAEIDWVFYAESYDVIPPKPDTPPEPDWDLTDTPWLNSKDHINYIIGYSDGLVHPERSITRAEVATVFYRLLTDEARNAIWSDKNIYPDVFDDSWFYIAVSTLTNGGLIKGYPDGTFRPNQPITRAELATIISRFDSGFGKLEITAGFEDVEGHWSEEYVEFNATRKYVVGYPDGTFKPDQHITRAETVTMVNRCLHRAVDKSGVLYDYITWPDNLRTNWFYYEIIEAANYHDYSRSDRKVKNQNYNYENWSHIRKPIDWKKHEASWAPILEK